MEKTVVLLPESLPETLRQGRQGHGEKCTPFLGGAQIPAEGLDFEEHLKDYERQILQAALEKSKGIKTKAAKLLKLSFRSFRYRLEKLGMD